MAQENEGKRTFTASGAITAHGRVKVMSGSTTTPPQVALATIGEQHIGVAEYAAADGAIVTVRLRNYGGTTEMIASEALSVGADLYAATGGKVADTSSGSAIGVALEAATANGDIIEVAEYGVLSTTAATVSIDDAGSYTDQTTVEAALQELYLDSVSTQNFISIPLTSLRETSSLSVGAATGGAGCLASDTTPTLAAASAADGCQVVTWVASGVDPVMFQTALPPNLDTSKDVVVHVRIKSESTNDAVGFAASTFFNEGDTAVADSSTTNQTATWGEKIITIAAADIPSGAQTMTCHLTPAAHNTDAMYLSAVWIEHSASIRTS